MANVAKYKDVKLPKYLADIIDKCLVGKEGYRSRNDYVIKTIVEDLKRKGFLKEVKKVS